MATSILIIALIVADIALLGVVLYIMQKNEMPPASVVDLTEERRVLLEMRDAMVEELKVSVRRSEEILKRVTKTATEVEMEVKHGSSGLYDDLKKLADGLATKFDEPLTAMTKQFNALEKLVERSQRDKEALGSALARGEKMIAFFNDKIPYEEILSEIEEKKYADARKMITKGIPADQIAKELNLSLGQVRMIHTSSEGAAK